LAKEIIEINMTYRQINCFELCYHNYLAQFTESRKISIRDAFDVVVFDFKGNCSEIYPLECDSAYFEILKDEEPDKQQTISFYYTDRKYTVISQTIKTTDAEMVYTIGSV
jgi:hypothetical protein